MCDQDNTNAIFLLENVTKSTNDKIVYDNVVDGLVKSSTFDGYNVSKVKELRPGDTEVVRNGRIYKKAIELHEQALRIYERTVGRMQCDAAYAILCMSIAYNNLGDLVKAEELGKEALHIYEKTLGPDHEWTKKARDELDIIQKAKSRGGGR